MRVLGIITARGGSKGIPKKNIALVAGKPLLEYTIEAAKQSTMLTRCVVSTEDEEIKNIAVQAGADVPFLRPMELAHDTSRSIDVVQHVLETLSAHGDADYDAVMVLQPTTPLRLAEDIDAAISILENSEADSVISVTSLEELTIERLKKIENGQLKSAIAEEVNEGMPRQLLPTLYKRNGAIYLTRTETIKKNSLYGKISLPYIMPAERSVDINVPSDLIFVEALIEYT